MSQQGTIRRILVALDGSSGSLAALEEAVTLAANFGAEVIGLFVEDINLVRLAELSVTREVGLFSATSRRLEIRYVERQFRGQAGRVRQALATLAEQAGIEWSFRVARGVIAAELLRAAAEADLIILGRVGLSAPVRKRLGSTARAILLQAPQLTLILHPGVRLGMPVTLLYDGSTVSRKALAAAAQLLSAQDGQLLVLVLADDSDTALRLQQEIEAQLGPHDWSIRYIWQRSTAAPNLIRAIQPEDCRVLVLPSDGSRLGREIMLALLDQITCPVLLVR